jgi:site-specific recombinase XerD
MTRFGNSSLFPLIHDYLKIYLPKQQKVSPNTARSYREALELLVDYVKEAKQVSLADVTFEMLTAEMILSFLDHLESERGCSISTRNNRLAAIRAFINYAADRDITTVAVLNELKKVPVKKQNDVAVVEYMSMAAITAIVEQTDADTPKGLRDRFFIMLMYDTGARIQEMVGIKLSDLKIDRFPKITLHGKGNKTRVVPLMDKTVQHLQKYILIFHNGTSMSSATPLFYSVTRGNVHPLSDRRIRYLLKEYGEKARMVCSEVPENVHPHLFRHSRAMHLYQAGMDLTFVSQWLGHANLETTLMYAHADTEHKRLAIAAATPPDNPLYSKLNSARYTVTDDDTLKRLTGLR